MKNKTSGVWNIKFEAPKTGLPGAIFKFGTILAVAGLAPALAIGIALLVAQFHFGLAWNPPSFLLSTIGWSFGIVCIGVDIGLAGWCMKPFFREKPASVAH